MTAGTGGIGGLPPVGASGICGPDEADCTISHATTGWCLQATGTPVIVVTRWACDPNDATPTVTMIDPSTGDVIVNQVVVPCGDRDWEVNQLCDFNAEGEVLATVTQIFQWDENTETLIVRLVRADDPTGPDYVVVGELGACMIPSWIDVETALVCGDTAGVRRQLTEMIVYDTRNGLVVSNFYLDADGDVVVLNPGEVVTVGDCWTPTLPAILDELEEANGTLDDLSTCCTAQTALLSDIEDNTDLVEPLLTSIDGHLNDIEFYTQFILALAHAEDNPHGSGDLGHMMLGVRNDGAVPRSNADGDYTPIATDSAGRVGITDLGGSITVDGAVSISNFPASVEIANDVGNPVPVNGTVNVGNFPATQNVAITSSVEIEVKNDAGNPVPVAGTVAVSNFPASVEVSNDAGNPLPVSVTNFPASVEVSNDVGNPLPVSGSVAVSNFPASVEVSNDVGNPLPVNGTVAVSNNFLTDAQLRAAAVPVTDAALATTNTHLANISGFTDGIEGLNTAILGRLTLTALLAPGQVAVGVAAVQMHAAGQALQQGVIVQAHPSNAAGSVMYVGIAGVTTGTGFPLSPGASVTLPVPNTNQVYLIGSVAGLTGAWIGV